MKKSLSLGNIKIIDKSGMLKLLLDFPLQCRIAAAIAKEAKLLFERRDFKNIVFSGLGGSAIGADLVRSYLFFEARLPMQVVREYELPGYVNSESLVFVCSYSGNTEETLSAYTYAKEKNAAIIAVSSGGALKERALKDGLTFIEIPQGLPPRAALGYSSVVLLSTLARLGLIKNQDAPIAGMIKALEDLRDKHLMPAIGNKDNIAKQAASKMFNKFPFVYAASVHFDAVALRLRGQLNENAKALGLTNVFPEMNHNEIVGWQNPKKLFKYFLVIMLRDKLMHPRVAKRMDITAGILKKEGVELIEVWSRGEDLLSRIFSLIYTGDFISYYLAILYGIDPTPVDRVTYLKNQLAKE